MSNENKFPLKFSQLLLDNFSEIKVLLQNFRNLWVRTSVQRRFLSAFPPVFHRRRVWAGGRRELLASNSLARALRVLARCGGVL